MRRGALDRGPIRGDSQWRKGCKDWRRRVTDDRGFERYGDREEKNLKRGEVISTIVPERRYILDYPAQRNETGP